MAKASAKAMTSTQRYVAQLAVRHATTAVPAPGLDLSGEHSWVRQLARQKSSLAKESQRSPASWTAVRLHYGWPDGQYVLESMWSPFATEGMESCDVCYPDI